jgi:hypothetical protein
LGARPTNAAVLLGPLVPNEARRVEEVLDVTLGSDALIEEPVASGGDSSLWVDEDDEKDEDGSKPE